MLDGVTPQGAEASFPKERALETAGVPMNE